MAQASKSGRNPINRSETNSASGMDPVLTRLRKVPGRCSREGIPMALVMVRAIRALARRMGADTGRLPKDNLFILRSGAAWVALLLIFGKISLFSVNCLQAAEKDTVLPGSGIHYPGGFDPNTVGEIRGKVYGYTVPASGPIQFHLDSGKETYIVLASPKWYWEDLGAPMYEGTEVRVRGSKSMGNDGRLYIIAQEMWILPSGKTLVLRDDNGFPLWKGPKAGTRGSQGGFGSPQKGIGGGPGGMGRGRR